MLRGLAVLLVFQLAGEVLSHLLALAVPLHRELHRERTLALPLSAALVRRLRVTDPAATGFALGVASHGLGTARAFELGETAGAFSGLGMGLNALATSLLVPALVRWLLP